MRAGADVPNAPPTPPPNNDCTSTTYLFKDTDSLSSVAVKYRTTMSQIIIDNMLTRTSELVGTQLTITCPGKLTFACGAWVTCLGIYRWTCVFAAGCKITTCILHTYLNNT